MNPNIIDIASSVMRAANKTLANMLNVRLEDMPSVEKKKVVFITLMTSEGTFTSVVMFQQRKESKTIKGGMVIYISSSSVNNLFESLGMTKQSSEEEIKDICGEFCNVLAGSFKTEMVNLGYQDLDLSLPRNYCGVIDESIEIDISAKYTLSFFKSDKGLFSVDVFMEGSS